jgi:3-oxosteroid 1-dehydrogenase
LAALIGVEVATFTATVEHFNSDARTGKDTVFGRGDSAYDRYYGDAAVQPNPCLLPLEKGPFYALPILPCDLGTKGGMLTDAEARVLHEDGSVIEGLYAVGNCAASPMGRSYPAAGATLGPGMTFAWLAARHALGVKD